MFVTWITALLQKFKEVELVARTTPKAEELLKKYEWDEYTHDNRPVLERYKEHVSLAEQAKLDKERLIRHELWSGFDGYLRHIEQVIVVHQAKDGRNYLEYNGLVSKESNYYCYNEEDKYKYQITIEVLEALRDNIVSNPKFAGIHAEIKSDTHNYRECPGRYTTNTFLTLTWEA